MAAKVRPCVVLSVPFDDQDRALLTVVPHTTSVRGTRFEAVVPLPYLREGAFDAQGLVSVPRPRLERRLGALTGSQLRPIEQAVLRWLGLGSTPTVQ